MSTALRTYYRGHSLVAMRDEVAAENHTFHFDHQGTTQCLTNQAGVVTDRFAADAWGVEVKRTGSSINPHWYVGNSGYRRQVGTHTDYVRYRYYVPRGARFNAEDPLTRRRLPLLRYTRLRLGLATVPLHVSPYGYVNNRPALLVDPKGMQARRADWLQPPQAPEEQPPGPDQCQDCCSAKNQEWYFTHVVGANCVIGGQPGQWSDCPDSNTEFRNCKPRREHCPDVEMVLAELIPICAFMCQGGKYPGAAQFGAATMCCYNFGRVEPKFCTIRCCISPEAGHMPPVSSGAAACVRYCLLLHEREHQTRECSRVRRNKPTKSHDYEFPFDECCAYIKQVSCLVNRYRKLCGLGRADEPCIKHNKTKCEKE